MKLGQYQREQTMNSNDERQEPHQRPRVMLMCSWKIWVSVPNMTSTVFLGQ